MPLAELREAMAVRTQVAGILRQLRLENIRNKAEAEEVAARQDFEVRFLLTIYLLLLYTTYDSENSPPNSVKLDIAYE